MNIPSTKKKVKLFSYLHCEAILLDFFSVDGDSSLNQRPRRSCTLVNRLSYFPSNTPRSNGADDSTSRGGRSSRRRGSAGEIRNLDQYSSDEEFDGGEGGRRRRYNMRENRRQISRYVDRFTGDYSGAGRGSTRPTADSRRRRDDSGHSVGRSRDSR